MCIHLPLPTPNRIRHGVYVCMYVNIVKYSFCYYICVYTKVVLCFNSHVVFPESVNLGAA